jgi:hypothetical protein
MKYHSRNGMIFATPHHTTPHHTTPHAFSKKKLFLVSLLSFFLPLTSVHAALEGTLETVNCNQITGWAWDNALPATRVKLNVYDVGTTKSTLLATVTANVLRKDLLSQGKGDGKYGFSVVLPAAVRNAVKHTLSVRFAGTPTELTNSPKITALACYGKLNDTGIKTCSDGASNGLVCPVTGYEGQDGNYGRDVSKTLKKIGKGTAGFDYSKIANNGSVLPATTLLGSGAKDWACTRDNVTGLIWEVKTSDAGLRDQNNTYSWYNADNITNGGAVGYPNYGTCTGGISCDTAGYVKAVNAVKLCGKSDWRMPKKSELHSIVDYSRFNPSIEPDYFPNTVSGGFWSSSPIAYDSYYAWFVYFNYGDGNYVNKNYDYAVRLVRAGQ